MESRTRPGRVVRSSLIRGEWGWGLIQATLPDPPQTLAASPSHPPLLLTIIVTLAEQLQESEQVLGEFIICHDLLSWVGGFGGGAWCRRSQTRKAARRCAHSPCTLLTHAQGAGAQGAAATIFKDTMRAMGIHDASGPNLRVQDISRRRLRGPES